MASKSTKKPLPQASPAFSWGSSETQFFYELNPDRILEAVDSLGYRCTGRCLPLNSMENRVYEIEIDDPVSTSENGLSYLIAKFYRPGRWSQDQLLEEHRFIQDLQQQELPAIAPLRTASGQTLHRMEHCGIWYALSPRQGGRNPDELQDDQLKRLGHLMARVHNIGQQQSAPKRLRLEPETYGLSSLDYLLEQETIPEDLEETYADLVEDICELSLPFFKETAFQRIHGDCHLGNLLWRMDQLYLVDFDDMVNGPCVQDLWLLVPGRDQESRRQFDLLLSAYTEMKDFDYNSLRLIEPLRALRYIHFSAWIAKRWSDPAFPLAFTHYGTRNYWMEQVQDLKECRDLILEKTSFF
jgi:Ser/Thr protein kinase RdoA (MazF antagonist)